VTLYDKLQNAIDHSLREPKSNLAQKGKFLKKNLPFWGIPPSVGIVPIASKYHFKRTVLFFKNENS